ncbi:hypothetical protein Bca52824_065901 [Brassica carinata]|uniref:Uncharacterized protein n=1 Tax=Brassica carinata TaxID=52824 RepID=A0A8X7QJD7_BRACI|nr:hypothetical protein Bca52824_065901 [Brassica carinata]
MSCIRYDEGGKGIAHGGCSVSSIEVNYGETDLTKDEFAEIEAVYASNGFGMREVDGTACEVRIKWTARRCCVRGEDGGDEDYDYNLWHDFVGRNCEWGDDKDEDGGQWFIHKQTACINPPSSFEDYVDEGRDYIGSSRISMENTEEASNNSGVKSSDQVPDTKNHSDPNQEEDPSVDSSSQILVLLTPPKPFNMHTRKLATVMIRWAGPQCVWSGDT